nr:cbb3-type cytochrome c oxidase subunit I [Streptomyces griseus]
MLTCTDAGNGTRGGGTDGHEAATTAVESGRQRHGRILIDWLTTTDHKKIGHLCPATSFVLFLAAGLPAVAMRAEPARPGLRFLSNEQFNQAFTQHGTIVLLLFATPATAGFANEPVPLQTGAPDVAFPRLDMFSYRLFPLGGLMVVGSFLTPSGPPGFGWTAYAPLNGAERSPGTGAGLWVTGLALPGFGTILTSVNFLATIIGTRAPGTTMFRMPVFTGNVLFTAVLVFIAFPVLAAALPALKTDRRSESPAFDLHHPECTAYERMRITGPPPDRPHGR